MSQLIAFQQKVRVVIDDRDKVMNILTDIITKTSIPLTYSESILSIISIENRFKYLDSLVVVLQTYNNNLCLDLISSLGHNFYSHTFDDSKDLSLQIKIIRSKSLEFKKLRTILAKKMIQSVTNLQIPGYEHNVIHSLLLG